MGLYKGEVLCAGGVGESMSQEAWCRYIANPILPSFESDRFRKLVGGKSRCSGLRICKPSCAAVKTEPARVIVVKVSGPAGLLDLADSILDEGKRIVIHSRAGRCRNNDGRSFARLAWTFGLVAFTFGAGPVHTDGAVAAVKMDLLKAEADLVVLNYDVADFSIETVKIGGRKYARIALGSESRMKTVGAPALPNVCRSIIIPDDARMGVNVTASEHYDLTDIDVAPSKGFIPRTVNPKDVPYTFSDTYDTDAFYPGELATLRDSYILRDYRGTVIELNPFQYNPVRRVLRVYTSITVSVSRTGPARINPLKRAPRPRAVSRSFHQIYSHHFINYTAASRYTPLDETGDMLIICHDAWLPNIQPLVDHKNALGISTTALGVSTIGNNPTSIKNYIQGVYEASDLAFVLLVGDANEVASPSVTVGTETESADPTYALLAGDDSYPDILVGRFSAQTAYHVDTQVERTIEYEQMPAMMEEWFKRATGVASAEGPGDDGEYDFEHLDNIRTDLLAYGYTPVDQIYDPGASAAQVTSAVNAGRGLINYTGHGSTYGWGTTGFSNAHVNALINDNMLPFVLSVACNNGTFDGYTCFAEAWLRATHGSEPTGAIAIYASSVSQHWEPPMCAQDEFVDLLVAEAYASFGALCFAGSCQMMDEYGTGGVEMYKTWHVFGDPSLRVFSHCSHQGTVWLGRPKYGCESEATVSVNDCGLNTDGGLVESVFVTIASGSEPAGETMLLTETEAASAEFEGSIMLSETNAAGVLWITEGETVTVTYIDADDGSGGTDVEVTATAVVDCHPPQISNVQTTDIEARSATVTFSADEPVTGTVHYGESCDVLSGQAVGECYTASPQVHLTDLSDNTTYFYTVEAEDEAGNVAGDDNGGACYTFSTSEVPDFFTELFQGDNDLDNLTILFIPNGSNDFYAACAEQIVELPTDPAGGTTLYLADDASMAVSLGGGQTVTLYGTSYSTFHVGSNGYITFGGGDEEYLESFQYHFDMPKVSGLFDDLDPSSGGTVSWRQFEDRAVVTWLNVPEFDSSDSNTFQIELHFNGDIRISYLTLAADDGLAGLSQGYGVDPDFFESDLSAVGVCGPRPPVAHCTRVNTPVETPVTITLTASDDGLPDPPGTLTYTVQTLPEHGVLADVGAGAVSAVPYTLVGHGDRVEYDPELWYAGADSFHFQVSDGGTAPEGGDSNVADVSISVGQHHLVHGFSLDLNPEWDTSGEWRWGQPTGGGSYDGDPTSGYTGPYVYGYNLDGDYGLNMPVHYLTMTALDCSDFLDSELRFRRWLGIEPAAYDHATVEVSSDGTNWTTVWNHTGDAISESSWSLQTYDISATADGQQHVYIRWGMGPTDGYRTYPGWNVDDIEIWAIRPLSDCNSNGTPDCQDIADGTSRDCNCNGIPDECDIAQGSSTDDNGNGIPDECDCVPADMVQVEPTVVPKNRFLSFVPGSAGRDTALRVTFTDLPSPFELLEGQSMWVGQPREVTENSGNVDPAAVPGWPTFTAATLQCKPYVTDWSTFGTVYVCHEGIVPGAVYEIQAVDVSCNPAAESSYTPPLGLTTSLWGDVVEDCATVPCGPPDGIVYVTTDVTAVLNKFKNADGAPIKTRCDLYPALPDFKIGIVDVTLCLDAFRGLDPPFEGPGAGGSWCP